MSRFHCQAIVFDMDGVLVDSMPQIAGILADWARSHRLDPSDVVRCSRGRTDVELVALVAPHLDPAHEARVINEQERISAPELRPIPGAPAFVAALGRTTMPWAVVTSSTRDVAEARLRATGVPLPGVLVTADDVVHGKPHPEPYTRAAALLGRSAASCVVIEDSPSGAASGVAAGMTVIGLATDRTGDGTVPGAHVSVGGFADVSLHADGRLDVRDRAPLALLTGDRAQP